MELPIFVQTVEVEKTYYNIQPGEVFLMDHAMVPGEKSRFLKLREQNCVNMETWHLMKAGAWSAERAHHEKLTVVGRAQS